MDEINFSQSVPFIVLVRLARIARQEHESKYSDIYKSRDDRCRRVQDHASNDALFEHDTSKLQTSDKKELPTITEGSSKATLQK